MSDVPHARYMTQGAAGMGGTIKQRPEDFLVDEVPRYLPCGEGEHVYLLVQKRGMTTHDMLRVVAAHFRVPLGALGYAGLKDKLALTQQTVSVHVPGKRAEDFPMLTHEHGDSWVRVLGATMHTNKLRVGHLHGNRFSIRVRNVRPADVVLADRCLRILRRVGVPNRFGTQRFGLLGNNHRIGAAIIKGDYDGALCALLGPNAEHPEVNADARACFAAGNYEGAIHAFPIRAHSEIRVLRELARGADAGRALRALDRTTVLMYLAAFQSAVFNRVVDARVRDGSCSALHPGDLAVKMVNGAVFAVDAAVASDPAELERAARLEAVASGPMWGVSMTRAGGTIDAAETAALEAEGVCITELEAFARRSKLALPGERRPLVVPVIDPEVEGGVDEHGAFVRVAFELRKGSYATEVLREIMKPERGDPGTLVAEDGDEDAR